MNKTLTTLSLAQERTYKRTRKLELSWYGFCVQFAHFLSLSLSVVSGHEITFLRRMKHNLFSHRGNVLSGRLSLFLFDRRRHDRTNYGFFVIWLNISSVFIITCARVQTQKLNRNRAKADIRNFYSTNQNSTKSCKAVPASRTCDGTAWKENITSWSWICWVHR